MGSPRAMAAPRDGPSAPGRRPPGTDPGPGGGKEGGKEGKASLFRPKRHEASGAATRCLEGDDDSKATSIFFFPSPHTVLTQTNTTG